MVGCFYADEIVYTVDVDSLVRQWCVLEGTCLKSYPLQTSADNNQEDVRNFFNHKEKVLACALARDGLHCVMAFEESA